MKYCSNDKCSYSYLGIEGRTENCPTCESDAYTTSEAKFREFLRDAKKVKSKITRRRMKQGLVGLIAGTAITFAAFNAPNVIRTMKHNGELDAKAKSIIIDRSYAKDIQIDEDTQATASVAYDGKTFRRLQISTNGSKRYVSQWWHTSKGDVTVFDDGDARVLDKIVERMGFRWENTEVTPEDSVEYESLIEQIAEKLPERKREIREEKRIARQEKRIADKKANDEKREWLNRIKYIESKNGETIELENKNVSVNLDDHGNYKSLSMMLNNEAILQSIYWGGE